MPPRPTNSNLPFCITRTSSGASNDLRRTATCSLFIEENERVVDAFLGAQPGARRAPLSDGQPAQWLPDEKHDGFYYALIEKTL